MDTILANAGYVIVLFLFFGFTIFVHELGHFLTAIKLGLVVDTFSIGFGPSIWQRTVNGITYKIGWIPFGGYVALPQLDPAGMEKIQGKDDVKSNESEKPQRDLPPVSPWKKIIVSISGAVGNMLFALVLAFIIYLAPGASTVESGTGPVAVYVEAGSQAEGLGIQSGDRIFEVNGNKVSSWYDIRMECLLGKGKANIAQVSVRAKDGGEKNVSLNLPESDTEMIEHTGISEMPSCTLGNIIKGGSAEAAGLKAGDSVVGFDGEKVTDWQHFVGLVKTRGDKTVDIVVKRKGELKTLSVTPAYNKDYDTVMIGVEPGMEFFPWMYHKKPFAQIKRDSCMLFRMLKALVTPKEAGQAAKGVGGPIFIFVMLWLAIKTSFFNGIGFLRMLNINLAIFNLLPIPILDGGHVMFALWEGITRRRVHPKVVAILMNTFLVLLLFVAVAVTYRDTFVFIPKLLKMRASDKAEPSLEQPQILSQGADDAVETSD